MVVKLRRLGIVAVLLLVACAGDQGVGLSPEGAASSEYWFESLPRMVATSDVVVLGTVTDIRQGMTVGEPGEEIQLLDVAFDVQEALYGSTEPSRTLTVQSDPFIPTEPEWRGIGNTVLLFMKVNTDPGAEGRYYPINEQSVYLVSGTDVQATTDHDSFSREVAAMTLDEIREKVKEAAEAIAAGDVKPQEPVGG